MYFVSFILSLFVYIVPCCGFVIFLRRANARLRQTNIWFNDLSEKAKASGQHVDSKLPGEIREDARKGRDEVRLELTFVGLGALCGVASLFVQLLA